MKIAIEIDNIIRNNNFQALKYFIKGGFDPTFDDENVDMNCSDLLSILPFSSNEERKTFKEIDYPYELFGCARTTSTHLHVAVDDFIKSNDDVEIVYFSLNETDLMIQSTYFFLSKGSRVRNVIFPKKPQDIWNECDVAVTINEDVIRSKPDGKYVVLINKSDNHNLKDLVDESYDSIVDLLSDKSFCSEVSSIIEEIKPKKNFFIKLFSKIFNYGK